MVKSNKQLEMNMNTKLRLEIKSKFRITQTNLEDEKTQAIEEGEIKDITSTNQDSMKNKSLDPQEGRQFYRDPTDQMQDNVKGFYNIKNLDDVNNFKSKIEHNTIDLSNRMIGIDAIHDEVHNI